MEAVFVYVARGSVLLPRKGPADRLIQQGQAINVEEFRDYEQNLKTMLEQGVLSRTPVEGSRIDTVRGEPLPGLPLTKNEDGELELKEGALQGQNVVLQGVEAKVGAIAENRATEGGKSAVDPALLEGVELSLAEAKELGLVSAGALGPKES